MNRAWQELADELGRWGDAGRSVEFWWRDDDAGGPNAQVERLLALAERARVPLALAVIPAEAEPALFDEMGEMVWVMQHGTDHRNRAPAGAKKTEFPSTGRAEETLERLTVARILLHGVAGDRMVPALAPPWNRIDDALIGRLPDAGLVGLSRYGARKSASPAGGVRQVNTHADIIDWQGSRGFVGEERALGLAKSHLVARREASADPAEATGWLTHHACHDEAAWAFLERLFEFCARSGNVRWRSAVELFS